MKVVAVVVTRDRAELLQACLDGLAAQTRPVDAVVVVDNASSDGSGDVARAHPVAADVHRLEDNLGGAGGFAAGMARALEHHAADWLWLMDDDTVPTATALAALLAVAEQRADVDALSSRAVWTDGREHPMNTQRPRLGAGRAERAAAARVGARPIRTASFVSFLVRASAARRHGLPYADYFIWGDDTEYSARVLRDGRGLRVPESVVEHRTAGFSSWQSDPGPRFRYDVRNKLWLLTRTQSFTWWERLLYGAAVVVGWARTLARSTDRRPLLRFAAAGAWEAARRRPRPTAEVLAGAGALAEHARAVEAAAGGPPAQR